MKLLPFVTLSMVAAAPAIAQENRQLDAHEHGVGELNIALDGDQIAMEFHAPGADIVGFEYEATSDDDLARIETALATLAAPLGLFTLSDAAGCRVTKATAELEGEEEHDDHDDHADGDDHDNDHDDHAEDTHDDHDQDDQAEAAGHTEFHAEYLLTCTDPSAISEMTFVYFDAFPNALEVDVQVLSASGATAFEVERDAPVLDLEGVF